MLSRFGKGGPALRSYAQRSVAGNQRGLSLIEIMVVVAIIGAMAGLGAVVVMPGNESKLGEQSVKLAGTIKFLHDESAMKNRYYRIVFDLDNKTYSVESSSEPVLVALEADAKSQAPKPKDDAEAEAQDEEAAAPSKGFTPDEEAARPVKLPEGIKFKDISVMHELSPRSEGTVHMYFFPNGWTEPVVVNFSDEEEESFVSLEVNPLTGRAKMVNEYVEVKEGALRPEGEK